MLLLNNNDYSLVLLGLMCLLLYEALVRSRYPNQKAVAIDRSGKFFSNPIIKERISGIVLMGVCPLVLIQQPIKWMFWVPDVYELYLVITLCLLITPVCKLLVDRVDNINHPVVAKSYNDPRLYLNTFLWIGYLAAYEFLLRGIFLFTLINIAGLSAGIIINMMIYAGLHIKKGLLQTVATLPFGILLIILALQTNSFWPAFIFHLNLALAIEWFMVKKLQTETFLTS